MGEQKETRVKTADVFVNIPVKSIAQSFTYHVPDALAHVGVGWRVFVPFGGRKVEGFVVAVAEKTESELQALGFAVKDILALVDEEAWFTPVLLQAAEWLASFYLCSLAEIMRLFMPGKSGLKITVSYMADEAKEQHKQLAQPLYRMLYEYVAENGPVSRAALRKALPELEELPVMLEKMTSAHILVKEYAAEKRDNALYERYVILHEALTPEREKAFSRRKAQLKLWSYLSEHGGTTSFHELERAGMTAATVKKLAEAGIVAIRRRRVLRDSYADGKRGHAPRELTAEQRTVVEAIQPSLAAGKYHGFLLYGVTGSGKTQVYIELARLVRAAGRKVIVLVPEIALTGQLVRAFQSYFAGDIIVMHSRLTLAERNDAVLRVRRGEAGIIIGARSALFTPADDVGLIILDEEQDASYKQDESPRYHARVVAEELAHLHQAVLLLGSATPSLETYHRARMGELTMLTMQHRVGDIPLPEVSCVDMRQELRMGNRHIISRPLEAMIQQTIAQHEQLIIMLNRRGFSTFVLCRSCGEVIKCPDCGLPLVYHETKRGDRFLLCHHCDIRKPVPDVCPKCGSRYIKYFGSGTEKLEQELHALVPAARVVRMDRDTTGGKFAHQDILTRFRRGEYDILLGTQMVAKGHDIPNVTAVGIISADSALHLPDFRAAERCFMLITQTAGRAGRHTAHGERGHVLVQTYNTEHYAVQCGIRQDYEGFYKEEIALRQALGYPPFTRLVKLLFQNTDETAARQNALAFVQAFQRRFPPDPHAPLGTAPTTNVAIGPAPAVIANFRGTYRFVVLVKAVNLADVQAFLREQQLHLRTDVAIDIDPITTM
ncbi:primosomal protein N' [uncultured Selenomonas sp.]|uniref:replication restart helicase PriA n=1 Tax=uncultured Selenomonas sp. TaxID=159275 RepID=UPI0025F2A311|nr:primosomal protein N' [uncultured Selenomonas sp.]